MAERSNRMSDGRKRPGERKALERPAPRQRDVGLPVRERAAPEIDIDVVERQPLRLVDRQRPREPQRELLERAGDRLRRSSRSPGRRRSGAPPTTPARPRAPCRRSRSRRAFRRARETRAIVPLTHRRSGSLRSRITLAPAFKSSVGSVGCALSPNSPVMPASYVRHVAGQRVEVGHVDALGGGVGRRQDDVGVALAERADRRARAR